MEAVVRPRRIVRSSVAKYSDKPMTATKTVKDVSKRAKQSKITGYVRVAAKGDGINDEGNLRSHQRSDYSTWQLLGCRIRNQKHQIDVV
jgi:hypothetical protein